MFTIIRKLQLKPKLYDILENVTMETVKWPDVRGKMKRQSTQ